MQPVYLVCGVPGSGKTWCARQMADRWDYVPHDLHYKNHADVVIHAAKIGKRPVITECPFAERELRDKLSQAGVPVIPYFVVEDPNTVKERYEKREGKPIPKNNLTRALSIRDRAKEWNAPMGTSGAILALLKQRPA